MKRTPLEHMYESMMAARPAYALTYLKIRCKRVVHYNGWLGIVKYDYVYAAMGC